MSSEVWNQLAEQRQRLQPTPKVSDGVIYHAYGDKRNAAPAIVSEVEGPGRIKVTVFPFNGMLQHKGGCHHVTHWIHDKPNETTKMNGAWSFPREAPVDAYEVHEAELAKRENALIEAEQKAKDAAKAFAKKAEERAILIEEKLGKAKKKATVEV